MKHPPQRDDVAALIKSFGVRSHYMASKPYAQGGRKYAVFGPAGQMTEPVSHAEAHRRLYDVVAQAVLDLFGAGG